MSYWVYEVFKRVTNTSGLLYITEMYLQLITDPQHWHTDYMAAIR